ncbi:MAG: DNA mismatch repair protein MutS [Pseudomonadota bacterium]
MSEAAEKSSEAAPSSPSKVTPMMAQYLEIKAANADCLLFYRMGDFYELFFDDAVEASRTLGITLTKRGHHQGEDIPMCGVPVHSADDYLERLIQAGYRIAVCEQTEDPAEAKKRGSKSVVRREVKRLVTAGTITEENILAPGAANYLAALTSDKTSPEKLAIAWCDLSTGEFNVIATSEASLMVDLSRIQPSEIIVPESFEALPRLNEWADENRIALSIRPNGDFASVTASTRLCDYFGVKMLDGFAQFTRPEQAASAAIIAYLERTQIDVRAPLSPPKRQSDAAIMAIDAATRANLELVKTLRGETQGSLLAAIDRTITSAGRRRLTRDIMGPLTDAALIAKRHDAVDGMLAARTIMDRIRMALRGMPDLSRSLSRLGLDRGGPRDLGALRAALQTANELVQLTDAEPFAAIALVDDVRRSLAGVTQDLEKALDTALNDELPLQARDGGFVRSGFSEPLDEQRTLRDDSRRVIAELQVKYSDLTAVKALKIRFNNVLGYFVEVGANHAAKLMEAPLSETFIHRQTMANVVRFSTVELSDLEARITQAADRALAVEMAVFEDLRAFALREAQALQGLADAAAALDVVASHAALAAEQNYARPKVDDSIAFEIEGGRHPVVEQALTAAGDAAFIANDCALGPAESDPEDTGRLWLLTGPNMAGKSTYLRQNALIAILAQAGGFVPAKRAHIGVVTRLFSRVGASDDLARGRSTFMVEMVETAAILNQADHRSLVILDEIGRGTATFDGLSIAWASVEHLHAVNKCRALFATHFHELTALSSKLERVRNATVKVKEWRGDVVFLHEVEMGAADRSYGIQVAKLAGLPTPVIERARDVLERLEAGERDRGPTAIIDDLPLFSVKVAPQPAANPKDAALREAIEALEPDHMSPRAALDALYALKAKSIEDS